MTDSQHLRPLLSQHLHSVLTWTQCHCLSLQCALPYQNSLSSDGLEVGQFWHKQNSGVLECTFYWCVEEWVEPNRCLNSQSWLWRWWYDSVLYLECVISKDTICDNGIINSCTFSARQLCSNIVLLTVFIALLACLVITLHPLGKYLWLHIVNKGMLADVGRSTNWESS